MAFISGVDAPEIATRHQGCVAALAEAGLPAPLLLETGLAADTVEAELVAPVDRHRGGSDGVVAASDVIAMALLRVLADRGISVPGEVRLVGYDDLPLAAHTVPRLTTIRRDIVQGAAVMVDALFERLQGRPTPSLALASTPIVRNSS